MEWTPLEDEFDEYQRLLEEAAIEGQLHDEETMKRVGYPKKLNLSDSEKDQLAEFIQARTQEAFEMFQRMGHAAPEVVGQSLLFAAISGMCWEFERIGR
jgi:hypothetical protein